MSCKGNIGNKINTYWYINAITSNLNRKVKLEEIFQLRMYSMVEFHIEMVNKSRWFRMR